jgi:acyl-CoA thioester hydrolase
MTELRESHAEKVEQVVIFFEDLDAFGMVNHGRFAALIERATYAFFARHGLGFFHEDSRMAVKEISITFEHPITTIGPVDVALWVEYIRNSSAKFGFCVRTGDITHAYGHRVVIKIDAETFRPAPWTEGIRQLVTESLLT